MKGQRLKVAYVANYPLPYHTPIMNELAKLVDLDVVYMSGERPLRRGSNDWRGFHDTWGVEPEYSYRFYASRLMGSSRFDFRVQVSVGVSRVLKELRPDVVLFSSWGPLMVEPLLWAEASGRAAVMWAESTRASGLLRGRAANQARTLLLRRVDAFVSNGSKATEYLLDLGVAADKIVTSRLPGNPMAEHAMPRREGENRFLFVGRLVARKDPLAALEAFGHVLADRPSATLRIVGVGPLERDLRRAAIPLGPAVSFAGHLEGAALAGEYSGADVLIVPSKREVWGLVVNEALAHGLYVIASDEVASACDLLSASDGVVVPAGDTLALAAAMRAAPATPTSEERAARRARMADCSSAAFAEAIARAARIAVGRLPDARIWATPYNGSAGEPQRALVEEGVWDDAEHAIAGPDAALAGVSAYVGDSRVYICGDQAIKVRCLHCEPPAGVHRLAVEADVLAALGRSYEYGRWGDFEYLKIPVVPGETLDLALPSMSMSQRVLTLARVGYQLFHLHRQGVAHNDVRPENVMVGPGGRLTLLDFDRAVRTHALRAAASDWIGIGLDSRASATPMWKLAATTLVPKSRSIARRVRGRLGGHRYRASEWGDDRAPECGGELELLSKAWALARSSDANAPGQNLAYYAFTYRHHHFIGERPWALRWEQMRHAVDFRGKTVLELGCNLGLLSAHALLHGATEVLAIDRDRQIVDAARLVSQALEVPFEVARLDFGGRGKWEDDLPNADIVTALSVLEWLPDKQRFLNFLGRHREVIFEGHDDVGTESDRLRSVGFDDVHVIGRSECGRELLHGKQHSPR